MAFLRVSLFGIMRVTQGHSQSEVKLAQSVGLLLAYLLLERQRQHAREALIGTFWADFDPKRARNCLNSALWRLRSALDSNKGDQANYLITSDQEVGFNWHSDFWLDVAEFDEQVKRVAFLPADQVSPAEITCLEEALNLYQGELLEGIYEDWALRRREQERLLYLEGLSYLLHYYKYINRNDRALTCAQKILEVDPLREEIHREVMRLHQLMGQRAKAVQQYETYREILNKELGINPMQETEHLLGMIMADGFLPDPQADRAAGAGIEATRRLLDQALANFDLARQQLWQAVQSFEALAEKRLQ